MTNEEMFLAIMQRMDTIESGITKLSDRMGALEERVGAIGERIGAVEERIGAVEERIGAVEERIGAVEKNIENLTCRMDTMEKNINMEFWAVRAEMDGLSKSLRQDIAVLDNKVDMLMFSKDVEGYEKLKIRIDVLENGYLDLREKIG